MSEKSQWTVRARVDRLVAFTVEADTKAEAHEKARAWEIVGDEQELDTCDFRIVSVTKDN